MKRLQYPLIHKVTYGEYLLPAPASVDCDSLPGEPESIDSPKCLDPKESGWYSQRSL